MTPEVKFIPFYLVYVKITHFEHVEYTVQISYNYIQYKKWGTQKPMIKIEYNNHVFVFVFVGVNIELK